MKLFSISILIILFMLLTLDAYSQVTIMSEMRPESEANSALNETSVVKLSDDNEIYFTRLKSRSSRLGPLDRSDILKLCTIDGKLVVENVTRLNSEYDDQVLSFHKGQQKMLIGREGNMFSSLLIDGSWKKPTPLNIKFFKNNADHISGSVSYDGKYLVVALESYNSYGVEDIYIAENMGGDNWSQLKNIGLAVNTSAQEISPFLSSDNSILYFSSNGHRPTKGSFDIYYSRRLSNDMREWSSPTPIEHINTVGSDVGFSYPHGEKTAFFISTQDSDGYGDIKSVTISPDIPTIIRDSIVEERLPPHANSVTVRDTTALDTTSTNERLTFKGFVLNMINNEPVLADLVLQTDTGTVATKTFANGEFNFKILPGKTFSLTIDADGYLSKDTILSTVQIEESFFTVRLIPLVDGQKVTLDHVLFERGTNKMLSGYESQLGLVVSMMKKNENVSIFLEGHTDNNGDARLNLKLSNQRVDAVKNYLLSMGISSSRISGKGYGGSRPIASNASEHTRLKNRRVEFLIRTKEIQ